MPLRAQGSSFVDVNGQRVYLAGAIICCQNAKARGWPLVDDASLELFADNHVNFTHVRIGPNTVESEGPEFVAYQPMGNNQVNLDRWNPDFWDRLRHVVSHARGLGIFIEITLIDAWVLERPELSAWGAGNNINGVDDGHCGIMQHAPNALHERWLRKVVQEVGQFENVMFEVGNETFDCGGTLRPEWELGVAAIVRDELQRRGFGLRPIGTNSHMAELEQHVEIDYINRHRNSAQSAQGKPVCVNEYGVLVTPNQYDAQLREAYNRGTHFHLWRHEMTHSAFLNALDRLRVFQQEIGQAY